MKSIPPFFRIIFRQIALISLILSFAVVAKAQVGPSVTLSVDNSSIVEAAGMSTITATLSTVSTDEVTVAIGSNASSTAVPAGTDYTLSTTSIIITAGNTTGTAIITAVEDVSAEGNETVVIDITGVTNGTEDGTQQKTVTIIDDDTSLTLTFTAASQNHTVSFTVTSTGEPISWLWDFEDGNTSTQQNPTHTYAASGTYTICLTATNTPGVNNTFCSPVTVSLTPAVASFTSNAANAVVSFTDTSTGGPISWLWDFGDGNTSTQQNTTHTYAAPGTYTICLTAANVGGIDMSCSQVTVSYPWAIFLPAMMNNVQK